MFILYCFLIEEIKKMDLAENAKLFPVDDVDLLIKCTKP